MSTVSPTDHLRGLRVGLNLLYLVPGKVGGTEIYALELIEALAREAPETTFTVVCAREAAVVLREREGRSPNVRLVAVPLPAAIKPLRALVEWTLLPLVALAKRFDVLHSLGTTSPPAGGRVRLVTIHDLIHEAFPANFPRASLLGLKFLVPIGARRAHRVIVDSRATRRDVIRVLKVPEERVDVVYAGLGMPTEEAPTPGPELRERHALGDRPVVLCVSALLPHKNLRRLLDAFAGVAHGRSPRPVLVIPGIAGGSATSCWPRPHASASRTTSGSSAGSRAPTSRACTGSPPRSSIRPSTKASGCRRWRPCGGTCPSRARTRRRCRRSPGTRRCSSIRPTCGRSRPRSAACWTSRSCAASSSPAVASR